MDHSSANRPAKRPSRRLRRLRKGIGRQARNVPAEFLQGAAYKLGSGAVTLLLLWWETHH